MIILAVISFLAFGFFFFQGLHIVPQQQVWIVQRLGKFSRRLEPGLNWLVPLADVVAYRHSLKEEALDVTEQTAITQDNVSVIMDGVVYVKIVDPFAASYGAKNPFHALTQLVQTTMRSEIGKIALDKTFEERESLNAKIVEAINQAAVSWGLRCMRYEIKDIKMPEDIRKAMELQMTAERQKRARILESEGVRQSHINESEGQRQAQINIAEGMREKIVLESEAAKVDRINRAKGEAEAIEALSLATSRGMERIAEALGHAGGEKAASLQIAEKYIEAFRQLAKEGNTILLPSNLQHPGSMIVEAMTLYETLKKKNPIHMGQREAAPLA
ncbi:MAG TPA: stomatin-like protein [Chlamydiales bacterium]|nr:stomatin-like protein [Chlamydiales bacterium]